MIREGFEYQTEYDWNTAPRKTPAQSRSGIIALALFAAVAVAIVIVFSGGDGIW